MITARQRAASKAQQLPRERFSPLAGFGRSASALVVLFEHNARLMNSDPYSSFRAAIAFVLRPQTDALGAKDESARSLIFFVIRSEFAVRRIEA